jgi:hypothetical protein
MILKKKTVKRFVARAPVKFFSEYLLTIFTHDKSNSEGAGANATG